MKRTNKKRNLKWSREKEYRELVRKEKEIWEAKRKKEVRELDEPYQNGYNLEFFLKEEFRYDEKHADLHILVDTMQHVVWCRDKSFKTKNWKGEVIDLKPSFKKLTPRVFDGLDERIKKYFILYYTYNSWSKKMEPHYEVKGYVYKLLRYKRSKTIVTHAYVVDGILESEEAFIDDKLYIARLTMWPRYSSSRSYHKFNIRKKRYRDKMYETACLKGDLYGNDFNKLCYSGNRYNMY